MDSDGPLPDGESMNSTGEWGGSRQAWHWGRECYRGGSIVTEHYPVLFQQKINRLQMLLPMQKHNVFKLGIIPSWNSICMLM